MGTKWNGLNRNKPPRKISKKKSRKMVEESKIRQELKSEANGKCSVCGLGATPPTYKMELHERTFRSAGGEISRENSVVVDSLCHVILQRYLFNHKGQCIRMIIMARKVTYEQATALYDKIRKYAEDNGLTREKINAENLD